MERIDERILAHTLEIISLLTGEVSLVQYLTNSLTVTKMDEDKKMNNMILNHTLEIIYLLTGEEYTIVKNNPPQTNDDQLTGECVRDDEMDEKDIVRVTIHSELDAGHSHVNSSTDPILEEEELNIRGQRQVKEEELPVNISEELHNVRPPQEEEPNISSKQKVKEEEIPININEGVHGV
ncbi:uncharacterized protein O3C94_022160 [Discoglossus pictus]